MTIRQVAERDQPHWAELREALWPGSLAEHQAETRAYFETGARHPVVFVAERDGQIVGFLEMDDRTYAPGCSSSPVPFIEGWYVEPGSQRQGIGRALVNAAEDYARVAGHHELASDVELNNSDGLAAHQALGYQEIERAVYFRKSLR